MPNLIDVFFYGFLSWEQRMIRINKCPHRFLKPFFVCSTSKIKNHQTVFVTQHNLIHCNRLILAIHTLINILRQVPAALRVFVLYFLFLNV